MFYYYILQVHNQKQWTFLRKLEAEAPMDDVACIKYIRPYADEMKRPVRLLAADGVPTLRAGPLTYYGIGIEDVPAGWYFRAIQYPTVSGWKR